jgi:succinoglycan biosynthesis protein ExoM
MPIPRYRYALRGIMHAGVVSGLLGIREIEQYGALESTSQ